MHIFYRYLDDIPLLIGELHAAVVLSARSHANIISIDTSTALSTPGVQAYISCADIPDQENNKISIVGINDEELFASSEASIIIPISFIYMTVL